MQKTYSESGRTLLEMLSVLAIISLFGVLAIILYNMAVVRQETDRDYEDILLTVSSMHNRGTLRTDKGMADTQLLHNSTRSGKAMSIVNNCPQDVATLTIKIENIDKKTCQKLMEKSWTSPFKPLFFLRGVIGEDVCEWAGSDRAGVYRLNTSADCTKMGAPEKGTFALVFNNVKCSSKCETNADCATSCGTCNEETHRCEGECMSPYTPETGCGTNDCVRPDPVTQTCRNFCRKVEYLESTGTQWINTDIIPTANTGAKIGYLITGKYQNAGDSNIIMVGNDSWRWGFGYRNSGDTIQVSGLCADGVSWTNYWVPIEYSVAEYNYDNDYKFYLNGNLLRENIPHGDRVPPGPVWLFGTNHNGQGTIWRPGVLKMYFCKIVDNGTLIRDFIPVLDPDGVPAMFDKVSKKLFHNAAGTDSFKYGSVVN